ncbi:Putative membrane protein (modular protein) [uncultured Mycobacterium sp.]|uniref:EamA domain-containing protein n=2 Tax=Mycobacteriaceae TaxID=1762 RepID=A0A064C9X9_9MYCO|nr:DMT family transporter [Mycolicibacterium aromaticivorans]KDE97130.1 hypothetical protein Y900_027990 [Mycolicibacterium aromaticivorans JS19b1 = JCM 16368]SBS77517.1 Putative membrane protein (modular protein) [uncultured Mycobacterium sp.]
MSHYSRDTHGGSADGTAGELAARPLRMVVIALAWGSCFVLIMWGMRDAPLLWFAALRALAAGAALLAATVLSRSAGRRFPRGGGAWALITVLALTNVTLTFGAMFASVTGATTGVAAVLSNSTPLLVVLPAWWLYGERPRVAVSVGVAMGFGGLLLVAAPSGGGRGAALALVAALGVTTGALLARRLSGVDLLMLGAGQFLLGGAVLALIALLIDGPPTTVTWSVRFTVILAVLALAGTALPYLLWFSELRRATLTSVTAWTLLVPVISVVLGATVLRERLTLLDGLGDAIVLAALAVVAHANRTGRQTILPPTGESPHPGNGGQ